MNQILVTKRLYITPELKRKKKMYKINLFLSVFLLCLLSSYYIYAEYDRNKTEDVSQEILADINFEQKTKNEDATTISAEENENLLVIIGDTEQQNLQVEYEEITENEQIIFDRKYTASNGKEYSICGIVNIPKISVTYPIITETTDELLKVSACKFWGADPNKVGNCCIVGHNFRNNTFFSKVPSLVYGDIIELTDLSNNTLKYEVYDIYTVSPDDVSCTSQLTNGKKEVTLITCTNNARARVIVKARQIK